MRRISSILAVTVMLIAVTLMMLYAHGRTQNANRRVQNANIQPAGSDRGAEEKRNLRKGKVLVKRLPNGSEGVQLKDGVLRLKPGYKFEEKDDNAFTVARMSGGLGVGGTWSCLCGAEGGGTCKANIVLGNLSCLNGTCTDCYLSVTVDKVKTNIMRY